MVGRRAVEVAAVVAMVVKAATLVESREVAVVEAVMRVANREAVVTGVVVTGTVPWEEGALETGRTAETMAMEGEEEVAGLSVAPSGQASVVVTSAVAVVRVADTAGVARAQVYVVDCPEARWAEAAMAEVHAAEVSLAKEVACLAEELQVARMVVACEGLGAAMTEGAPTEVAIRAMATMEVATLAVESMAAVDLSVAAMGEVLAAWRVGSLVGVMGDTLEAWKVDRVGQRR